MRAEHDAELTPGADVTSHYDGLSAPDVARLLDLPQVTLLRETPSTMDVAHELARAGAPAGTLVLAESQLRGRGRGGRSWSSARGGIWLTLVERPTDEAALDVLSLRVGLRAAAVLDRFCAAPVILKWPNDLLQAGGKLGGILVEARWRDGRPEWVAIGIGLNTRVPMDQAAAAAMREGILRSDVLAEIIPAVRAAAAARGPLAHAEIAAFDARHVARGRRVVEPARGTVLGLALDGALRVATDGGIVSCKTGSLIMDGADA